MTFFIAVSGKGGTGKTSVLAMILKSLVQQGERSILVLDGDPDSNMPDVLGISVPGSIADITDKLRIDIQKGMSPLIEKNRYLEGAIFEILTEKESFDLLVLGAIEKEGCYCLINAQLTTIIQTYSHDYKYVLLDLPAGLEHINRGVIRSPDLLLVVTDGSKMGFSTSKRIEALTKTMSTGQKKLVLIGNRVSEDLQPIFEEFTAKNGYEFGGLIPEDKELQRMNLFGPSLLELSEDSPAFVAVSNVFSKYILQTSA
ncbi:MAG: AAA family ATPase [Candidatus Heimdallarchaeota archaeon]